jgi:excisionase family DNA binding protein
MPNEWLSTEDVARMIGMSTEFVRQQIEAGRLPATKFLTGQRATYRIRASDLEEFLRHFTLRTGGG